MNLAKWPSGTQSLMSGGTKSCWSPAELGPSIGHFGRWMAVIARGAVFFIQEAWIMKKWLMVLVVLATIPWLSPSDAAPAWVTALEFSSDGLTAATGDDAGGLALWSSSGQVLKRFPGHGDRVHGVALRGSRLISWARDESVVVTDLSSGKQLKWKAPEGPHISTGQVNLQGTRLATRGTEQFLFWDLDT